MIVLTVEPPAGLAGAGYANPKEWCMEPFDYVAPRTLSDAMAALNDGRRTLMLAGGTDLIIQLREGRRQCDQVLDLKHIPEMMALRFSPDGSLEIGAAVPLAAIYEHPEIRGNFPALVDAASIIGGTAVQSRASLGGNLCNASPAADSPPALMVLGATVVIASPAGTREIPVEDLFAGPGQNSLQPGELMVSVRVPAQPARSAAFYHRFIPRNEMDIAVASAGVRIQLASDGATIADARVALGAVAPTPILVPAAGAALIGRPPGPAAFAAAGEAAAKAATPIDDMRGGIAQRKHLAKILTIRALEGALARLGEAN